MSWSHPADSCNKIGSMRTVLFSWFGVSILALTACSRVQHPKPARYILDNGVTGWVKVTYNRPDAPELPEEDGFAIVRISHDMSIATRSRMNPSWDGSEFYYRDANGQLVRLSKTANDQSRLWGMEKTSNDQGDREVFLRWQATAVHSGAWCCRRYGHRSFGE